MAKELPYFKFEPNQWENGNIQICTREEKGLFIDICSMYWSRLGDLSYKLALQKLCNGNATAIQSLCDDKIIELIDGKIFIKFLSEQLSEFEDVSEQNSKNAKKRWEKYRKQKQLSERNATALQSQSERNAIREEKRRKYNTYTEKDFLKDWNDLRTEILKKPSYVRTIQVFLKDDLKNILNNYTKEEIQTALKGLFKQKVLPNNMTSMQSDPKHFIQNFDRYLQAGNDMNPNLYGTND